MHGTRLEWPGSGLFFPQKPLGCWENMQPVQSQPVQPVLFLSQFEASPLCSLSPLSLLSRRSRCAAFHRQGDKLEFDDVKMARSMDLISRVLREQGPFDGLVSPRVLQCGPVVSAWPCCQQHPGLGLVDLSSRAETHRPCLHAQVGFSQGSIMASSVMALQAAGLILQVCDLSLHASQGAGPQGGGVAC